MNIIRSLRRWSRKMIVIGGLIVSILMCVWPRMIDWPLLPVAQSDLAGTWSDDSSAFDGIYLTFTAQAVRIQPKGCCRSYTSYPISIADGAIVYPDRQEQQSYRIGQSIRSFFMASGQSQIVITTPGPIPIGVYTYLEFSPSIHWDPSP